jgi:hypothetical protein
MPRLLDHAPDMPVLVIDVHDEVALDRLWIRLALDRQHGRRLIPTAVAEPFDHLREVLRLEEDVAEEKQEGAVHQALEAPERVGDAERLLLFGIAQTHAVFRTVP